MPDDTPNNAHSSNQKGASTWRRVLAATFAEDTRGLFKNLSIAGLITAAVGSYFQYVSWREQQKITQYQQDFDAANTHFADAASVLSTAMNLQQFVFFNFKDAVDAGVNTKDDAFQTKAARAIYPSYVDARNTLRERIDVLAYNMETFIDLPSDFTRDPTIQVADDPLNSHSVGNYNFDCDKYFPDSRSVDTLTTISIPTKNLPNPLQIDWRSTKHHIIIFQYCFEGVHSAILAAREWASASPVSQQLQDKIKKSEDNINASFDGLIRRFNSFAALSKWRLEDIRNHYQIKSYPCHLLQITSWCS